MKILVTNQGAHWRVARIDGLTGNIFDCAHEDGDNGMRTPTGLMHLGTLFKILGCVWLLVAGSAAFFGSGGLLFGTAAIAFWAVGWAMQGIDKP
ncbi:MAG: hypothetical protein EPN70_14330 [Paraburkholderia sp.]|uniref:Uncharacterized protein n=2 Tax=Burkholderiaceae TaxID=119060 RepID=A0ABW0J338_9BURK|nr:MAG: hypothetical protein EPN70_14330 [Paraburkholderia sp.]TAM30023.1 MAG: hypothetical protein EPN59_10450 [Paraburkholderia sp.]